MSNIFPRAENGVRAATGLKHGSEPARALTRKQPGTDLLFWTLITFYAFARVLQIHPGKAPMLMVVALHVVPPAVFALIHGAKFYRWRGILAFVGVVLIVGNVFENLGVRTGIPYGRYYFTDVMGPKLLVVPILLGLAYVGMAYLSWTIARIILDEIEDPLSAWRVVTLPLIAAFIMVAWDLSMDPVWSTILHAWIWVRGGAYFGVPLTNFLGWYVAVYVIYQLFAFYLKRRPAPHLLPVSYWRQAILFYGASAAGNLLLLIPQSQFSVVSDHTGMQWRVRDITEMCALVTIFTMGAFTVLAWVRLYGLLGLEARSRRVEERLSNTQTTVRNQ